MIIIYILFKKDYFHINYIFKIDYYLISITLLILLKELI